jgi:hypothetical protein
VGRRRESQSVFILPHPFVADDRSTSRGGEFERHYRQLQMSTLRPESLVAQPPPERFEGASVNIMQQL